MKKLLSITLALALVMSLFCVVPASATQLQLGLPYLFEDFEDESGYPLYANEVVSDGYNSAKAGKYNQTIDGTSESFYIKKVVANENLSHEFAAGESLQITFMIKLAQALESGKANVHFLVNAGSWVDMNVAIPDPADTTNWQKVTVKHTFSSAATLSSVAMRFGPSRDAENAGANSETKLSYFIDDFEAKVVPAESGTFIRPYDTFNRTNHAGYSDPAKITAEGEGYDGGTDRGLRMSLTASTATTVQVFDGADWSTKISKTVATGDVINFSAKLKIETPLAEGTKFYIYFEGLSSYWTGVSIAIPNPASTDWQDITGSLTLPDTENNKTMTHIKFVQSNNPNVKIKHADGTEATSSKPISYIIDNFSLKHVSASEVATAEAAIPTVTAATATQNASDKTISLSYTFKTGLTDASIVKLINTVGTEKGYIATYEASEFANSAAVAIPTAYENATNLSLEIVPVAANGWVGTPVTVAIAAAASIEGTTLTQAAGSVTIETETAITAAKLIFVTYDANGKMVDWEAVDVTLAAQGTGSFAPVDLTAGNYTKAMLWQDMTKCVPLADMIQY